MGFTVDDVRNAIFGDSSQDGAIQYQEIERYSWDEYQDKLKHVPRVPDVTFDEYQRRREELFQSVQYPVPKMTEWRPWDASDGVFEFVEMLTSSSYNVRMFGLPVEGVESYGGEGQGDAYWAVFKVGDRHFKLDGYYASYDGGYYDELYEVFPKKVEVIQWEKS